MSPAEALAVLLLPVGLGAVAYIVQERWTRRRWRRWWAERMIEDPRQ